MQPTIRQLIQTVCIVFQVAEQDLTRKEWNNRFHVSRFKKPSRYCPRNVTEVKQVVCYIACKHGIASDKAKYKEMWLSLGYSNWSLVAPNYKLIGNRVSVEKDLAYKISVVEFLCCNSNFIDILTCQ